jgi:hypothetical protein
MKAEVLTLHFRNGETLRQLERRAAILGVSPDELAEAAIEIELASMGSSLEDRLTQALKRLESSGPDLDQAIHDFARSEAEVEDPLKGHRVDSPDAYGIGALFGHCVERG